MIFSVQGVHKMQEEVGTWTPNQMIEWIHKGFDCLADSNRHAEWHEAFAPLRFYPGSDASAQFAAALMEADRAGLTWPRTLRLAAEDRLRSQSSSEQSVTRLAGLWSCIEASGFVTQDLPVARFVVKKAEKLQTSEPAAVRNLLMRVANSAAAASRSGAQFQFFVNCLKVSKAWDDAMVMPYLYAQMHSDGSSESATELWREALAVFRAPITKLADPRKPAGRTLIGALLRWLELDGSSPPSRPDQKAAEDALRRLGLHVPVEQSADGGPRSVRITVSQPLSEHPALDRVLA